MDKEKRGLGVGRREEVGRRKGFLRGEGLRKGILRRTEPSPSTEVEQAPPTAEPVEFERDSIKRKALDAAGRGAASTAKAAISAIGRLKPTRKPVHPDKLIRSGQMQERMGTTADFGRKLGSNPLTGRPMAVRDLYFMRRSRQPSNVEVVIEGLNQVDSLQELPITTGLSRTEISQALGQLREAGYDLSYWER